MGRFLIVNKKGQQKMKEWWERRKDLLCSFICERERREEEKEEEKEEVRGREK